MLAVDEMVGSLVEELEAAGELDNTFIFFTSDNGFEQGKHRLQKGKNRAYEESSHVPLLVRGPGGLAGSKTHKLALNTDFAPTFADLAGAEFQADGRSLAPLLGGDEDPSWRTSVLLERLLTQRGYQAVRTETHKYVEYNNGETELYDLRADPYELDNIYERADASLVEDLKARLEALRDCNEEGCWEAEDAPLARFLLAQALSWVSDNKTATRPLALGTKLFALRRSAQLQMPLYSSLKGF